MADSDSSESDLAPEPAQVSAAMSPFDPNSEVGRALADVDWSATDLGPWQQWPVSLSTAVRTMLGSRFAMCMLYGERSIFLCNDTYRHDSLGDKFPWALGKPMATVWPEVWDVASERIRSVRGGRATWDEGLRLFLERSGYTEETYHTFCYGPVHDDAGAVAGVLCVVSEDTTKVLADRRMALLRDVNATLTAGTTRDSVAAAAHRTLSNAPPDVEVPDVPFAVGYLVDPDDPDTVEVHWSASTVVGDPATPPRVSRGDAHPWADAMFGNSTSAPQLVALDPGAAWPAGSWPDQPTQAMVLPLRQAADDATQGCLVVGLNPYRELDDDYAGFVQLLADQLANALARADAFAQERHRHDELAELDRAKTTFFTNVSHELRTPLTLLLGPAADALVDDSHPLDDVQRARFEVVSRNGERLLKLVNTLLDFSRLEAGRMTARFEQLDLARFTDELVAMFESAYARVGLTLTVDTSSLPQRPYVDREMWAKVVLNLLSNALKATFTGGVTVRLVDEPDGPLGTGTRLEVTDTGVGIPAGEVDRLFERFHRVAGAQQRSHEGSGIGLALVSELVGVHGGDVGITSTPGVGTTFTVRIPYGRGHLPADQVVEEVPLDDPSVTSLGAGYLAESLRWAADPLATTSREPAEATGTATSSVPQVLVVDDSADVRDYVRSLLADEYRVTFAGDGEQALREVAEDQPDLVVTDVMMPVLDGFGLLTELRQNPDTAHIPVIMLSARSGDTAMVEGLEAGADDYLIKPFTARELRARVRANLELDRVRRVVAELERSRTMLDNAEQLARIGSWEVDLQKNTVRISAELARMSGRDAPPSTPLPYDSTVSMTAPEDRAALHERIACAMADGTDVDVEVRALRRTGEPFQARVRASITADTDGRPLFLRGSTQDITEQRAAEAELAAAHALREVALREHTIANELQRSLLPDQTFDVTHVEIAAYYRAGVEGTQVGGDWYDVIDLGDGRTALVIGDVMGRGVRAAAVMGQLRAATRAYARLSLPPARLISLLDDTVRELGEDMIVTCVYVVYDPAEQVLDYANAGHPPPLLWVPGKPVQRLEAGGPPLGAGRGGPVSERVAFTPETTLVLYTDGLVERRDRDIDERIELLMHTLRTSDVALAQLPAHLAQALLPDSAHDAADDDVAILVCRSTPDEPGTREATHRVADSDSSVSAARQFAVDTMRRWDVTDEVDFPVRLAVSELVTNALNHGAGPALLRLRLLSPGRLRVEVQDGGTGQPVVRQSGPDEEHGRGLLLVATTADAWGIDDGSVGKTVWCEFTLDAAVQDVAS